MAGISLSLNQSRATKYVHVDVFPNVGITHGLKPMKRSSSLQVSAANSNVNKIETRVNVQNTRDGQQPQRNTPVQQHTLSRSPVRSVNFSFDRVRCTRTFKEDYCVKFIRYAKDPMPIPPPAPVSPSPTSGSSAAKRAEGNMKLAPRNKHVVISNQSSSAVGNRRIAEKSGSGATAKATASNPISGPSANFTENRQKSSGKGKISQKKSEDNKGKSEELHISQSGRQAWAEWEKLQAKTHQPPTRERFIACTKLLAGSAKLRSSRKTGSETTSDSRQNSGNKRRRRRQGKFNRGRRPKSAGPARKSSARGEKGVAMAKSEQSIPQEKSDTDGTESTKGKVMDPKETDEPNASSLLPETLVKDPSPLGKILLGARSTKRPGSRSPLSRSTDRGPTKPKLVQGVELVKTEESSGVGTSLMSHKPIDLNGALAEVPTRGTESPADGRGGYIRSADDGEPTNGKQESSSSGTATSYAPTDSSGYDPSTSMPASELTDIMEEPTSAGSTRNHTGNEERSPSLRNKLLEKRCKYDKPIANEPEDLLDIFKNKLVGY